MWVLRLLCLLFIHLMYILILHKICLCDLVWSYFWPCCAAVHCELNAGVEVIWCSLQRNWFKCSKGYKNKIWLFWWWRLIQDFIGKRFLDNLIGPNITENFNFVCFSSPLFHRPLIPVFSFTFSFFLFFRLTMRYELWLIYVGMIYYSWPNVDSANTTWLSKGCESKFCLYNDKCAERLFHLIRTTST